MRGSRARSGASVSPRSDRVGFGAQPRPKTEAARDNARPGMAARGKEAPVAIAWGSGRSPD